MDSTDLEGTECQVKHLVLSETMSFLAKISFFLHAGVEKNFILTHNFELSNAEPSQSEACPYHLMGQRPGKTNCLTWRGLGLPFCLASPCDSSLNRQPQHPLEERRMAPKMSTCQSLEPVNMLPFMSKGFSRCN